MCSVHGSYANSSITALQYFRYYIDYDLEEDEVWSFEGEEFNSHKTNLVTLKTDLLRYYDILLYTPFRVLSIEVVVHFNAQPSPHCVLLSWQEIETSEPCNCIHFSKSHVIFGTGKFYVLDIKHHTVKGLCFKFLKRRQPAGPSGWGTELASKNSWLEVLLWPPNGVVLGYS